MWEALGTHEFLLLLLPTVTGLLDWGQSVGGLGCHIEELDFILSARGAAGLWVGF